MGDIEKLWISKVNSTRKGMRTSRYITGGKLWQNCLHLNVKEGDKRADETFNGRWSSAHGQHQHERSCQCVVILKTLLVDLKFYVLVIALASRLFNYPGGMDRKLTKLLLHTFLLSPCKIQYIQISSKQANTLQLLVLASGV